jgi:TatD DNase family protein
MIDSHCHLQAAIFEDIIGVVISEAKSHGISKFMVNGTSENDWERIAELARSYPEIIPNFGLHPWYLKDRTPGWDDKLASYLYDFPEAGVGEIGLDRWMKHHDIEEQLSVFEVQWRLAIENSRSISVHCLRAWGHLNQALRELPESRFLLHSYSGSEQMVQVFTELGAYFSISGYFFRPDKARKLAVFDRVPENRLLLETDAPEMNLPKQLDLFQESPVNHPANLTIIYRETAKRKGLSMEELKTVIQRNFRSWRGSSFS